MDTLGKRLKCLRSDAGLTQNQIAKKLGIPQTTWSNYEHDKNVPALGLVDRICCEFQVNLDWLLFGRGMKQHGTPLVDLDLVHDVALTLEEFLQSRCHALPPGPKADMLCQICALTFEEQQQGRHTRATSIVRSLPLNVEAS